MTILPSLNIWVVFVYEGCFPDGRTKGTKAVLAILAMQPVIGGNDSTLAMVGIPIGSNPVGLVLLRGNVNEAKNHCLGDGFPFSPSN